jgi:2-polyprenyl-6-methoxyphenol hydroxylase-like FAD-dependent oxidoreductase
MSSRLCQRPDVSIGMNLGMCDAITLGRMLSEHIKSGAKDTRILEEYSKKRQIVAKEVIALATTSLDGITSIAAMPVFARRLVGGIIDHLGFVKKLAAMRLSGLVNRVYD